MKKVLSFSSGLVAKRRRLSLKTSEKELKCCELCLTPDLAQLLILDSTSTQKQNIKEDLVKNESKGANEVFAELRSKLYDIEDLSFLQVIQRLPYNPPVVESPVLPLSSNKTQYTLVLDLDETLVHCSTSKQNSLSFPIQVQLPNKQERTFHLALRPHVQHFLKEVSR